MICLVDERISNKCERSLLKRGFRIIKMPRSQRLSEAVSAHPDMLLFYHNKSIITSADYCENAPYVFTDIRELADVSLSFTDDVQEPMYPQDAIFNSLVAGECIFLKADTVASAVKSYALDNGLKIVPVKQGYPACTTLVFGNGAITADKGMASALKNEGFSVTLISNGDISLPPYEYGFIGGASGVFGNTVYFLGDISTHRDSTMILNALKSEGFNACSLSDEPLADLGRIIFID